MDIIIKSFNRPHYLDRALFTIYKHVKGNFKVRIVDDGTPEKYLDKIQTKYPEIEIIKTSNYPKKVQAISENLKTGAKVDGFTIPINDWKKVVEEASDHFIMTEDDVWFTKDINSDELVDVMQKHNSSLIKIAWISNRKISAKIIKEENSVQFLQPQLFAAPRWIMDCFFENKFKVFSILYRLNVVNNNTKSEYWMLNALLTGLFDKKYWLYLWSTLDKKVNELEQIKNATQWYREHKSNPYLYAKLNDLVIKTTFQSSATTSYHEHYGINLDINRFNHLLNEAWYDGELEVTTDLPKDISHDKIKNILDKNATEDCNTTLWDAWTQQFKQQYILQEVDVD